MNFIRKCWKPSLFLVAFSIYSVIIYNTGYSFGERDGQREAFDKSQKIIKLYQRDINVVIKQNKQYRNLGKRIDSIQVALIDILIKNQKIRR